MVFRQDLSNVQQTALAFMPVPTGFLSIAASFAIIVVACRSPRSSPYRRILLGLSVSDILVTTAILTGPLMVPRESSWMIPLNHERNEVTCNLSGILSQMAAISNSIFSGFLAVYFLCTVRWGWSPSRFARIEPYVYMFIVTFVILMCAISLRLKVFETSGVSLTCWLVSGQFLPLHVLFYSLISLSCTTIFVCNLSIYLHVRSLTKLSLRRSMNPSVALNRKRLVATQSFGYVAAFAFTWIPGMLVGLHDVTGGALFRSPAIFFFFMSFYLLLMPFTGVLNLMVFLRPAFLQCRQQLPDASRCRCVQLALSNAFQDTRGQSSRLRVRDGAEEQKSRQQEEDEEDSTDPTDSTGNVEHAV